MLYVYIENHKTSGTTAFLPKAIITMKITSLGTLQLRLQISASSLICWSLFAFFLRNGGGKWEISSRCKVTGVSVSERMWIIFFPCLPQCNIWIIDVPPPLRIPVESKGLVRDPLLKISSSSWWRLHPGWGVDPRYTSIYPSIYIGSRSSLASVFWHNLGVDKDLGTTTKEQFLLKKKASISPGRWVLLVMNPGAFHPPKGWIRRAWRRLENECFFVHEIPSNPWNFTISLCQSTSLHIIRLLHVYIYTVSFFQYNFYNL